MWTLLALSLLSQADDILADEAKTKTKAPPSSAPAAAPVAPAPAPAAAPAAEAQPPAAAGAEKAAPAEAKPAAATGDEKPSSDEKKEPAEGGWLHDLLHSGAMGYMIQGGIFMWPILILGVLAFGVIIERSRALMMLNTKNEALRGEV
ncbi:MAG: hypothetical protein SFU86_16520, partial [Pirellulaceae bacterium]|nr:hypothetical protein [Pirellulaceae bacterium]